MKSRTSFFNGTVLKKDFTRFLPVWLIYLIGGLLVSSVVSTSNARFAATSIHDILSYAMGYISCGYAIVVAMLLWGNLFNSRMCNMLHALPLRREGWFFTHFTAGILMSVLPNIVIALTLMPTLEELWYVALIWLGASTLMFLFFFSLATLCVMATGNRFAALLVYGIANFFSFEIVWVIESLIVPELIGVRPNYDFLLLLSPSVKLMGNRYYVKAGRPYGDGWGYLFALSAIGIVFAALALWLYRRRKLEVAGDFAAIAPTRWLVSILGSIGCGMFFRLFSEFISSGDSASFWMLFIGLTVGFFLLQMLLQRNVKVLNKKTVIKWGILVLCFALFLVCGAQDVLGIASYVPKAKKVESVIVSGVYLPSDMLEALDNGRNESYVYDYVEISDPAQIETVLNAHALATDEAVPEFYGKRDLLTLHYRLRDGRTLTRSYYLPKGSNAYSAMSPFFDNASYFFCVKDFNALVTDCTSCQVEGREIEGRERQMLLERMWADADKGLLITYKPDDAPCYHVSLDLRVDHGYKYAGCYLPEGSSSYEYTKTLLKVEDASTNCSA